MLMEYLLHLFENNYHSGLRKSSQPFAKQTLGHSEQLPQFDQRGSRQSSCQQIAGGQPILARLKVGRNLRCDSGYDAVVTGGIEPVRLKHQSRTVFDRRQVSKRERHQNDITLFTAGHR